MGVPPLGEDIQEKGLEEAEIYITLRQNMDMQYIVTRPIMELCGEAE